MQLNYVFLYPLNFVEDHKAQLIYSIKNALITKHYLSTQGDDLETDIPAKHLKTQKNSWVS